MKTSIKITVGIVAIIALSAISTFAVKAVSSCYPTSGNCLTRAQGIHLVTNNSGAYWYPGVRSYTTSPAMNMDDIGYGYWNIKHGCNGNWTWGYTTPYGSVSHYTNNFFNQEQSGKPTCTSNLVRSGYSGGTHDHYKSPYSHMYLFSSAAGLIP